MNEVKRLTKEDIISGRDLVTYFFVKEFDGEVALRPLTGGQFNQVQAIKSASSTLKGKAVMGSDGDVDKIATAQNLEIIIDSEKAAKYDFEGDATAIAFSMSSPNGETWTVDEIMKIRPPGVIKKIATQVYKLSDVDESQVTQIENFRAKQ